MNHHIGRIVLGSMCVLEIRCGWVGVVSVLQAEHTHRTKNNTTNVVIQQNSRMLLMMDILMPETC